MPISLSGCGATASRGYNAIKTLNDMKVAGDYFTVINSHTTTKIMYANDTHVKYMYYSTRYNDAMTALYNADGSVQIYNENEEDILETKRYINANSFADGYFTIINDNGIDRVIMYANDTGVKYMYYHSGYGYGMTPLYNEDGTIQVYNETVDS